MRHHSSIAVRIIFVAVFFLFAITATAQKNKQFKKPITSPRDRIESSNAKWNVGILGGGNLTTWFHFHSPKASDWYLKNYKIFDTIPHSLGYFGGIAVERMVKRNLSVGLNIVYAQHSVHLGFKDEHFPYTWDDFDNSILYGKIEKTFKAKYHTIEAYIPVTYYIGLASKQNIIPYVYVAPRVSYVLPDSLAQMTHTALYTDSNGDPLPSHPFSSNTVEFNQATYQSLNVGLTAGVGSLFRINVNNYYFLMKFDISANMNGISTFKKGEVVNNEFNYLRHSADAQATLTLMLPIKKQLKGACMSWGEYD